MIKPAFAEADVVRDAITGAAEFVGIPAYCGNGGTFTGAGGGWHTCTLNDVSAKCQKNPATSGNCTTDDQGVLALISACSSGNGGSFFSWQGYRYGCSDTAVGQAAQAENIRSQISNCSLTDFNFSNCIWSPFIGLLSSAIIQPAVLFLGGAGVLFDWVIQHTVIGFSDFYKPIASGVETAWTAFRDIANILIIGIFTFIAISIILGIKTFGQKKLIANVLIVAVLINFSLLFAKVVVDASNYTAAQLYNAAGFSAVSANANNQAPGIAEQFMKMMGVASFSENKDKLTDVAKSDSWWDALFYALFSFIILIAAALVLLYGCFLFFARFIIIIMLFITAAVAFASYLIPKWASSSYGWSTWWSSLLKGAVLAPAVMFFLWATITVGSRLQVGPTNALGTFSANPTNATGVNALASYIIILGLLFLSFKMSSLLSSKIAGFNIGAMATALPFTFGARIAGLALRNAPGLGGRGSAIRALNLEDEIAKERINAQTTGNYKPLARLMRQQGRAETRSKSSFNLMNTEAAKAVMGGIGVSGFAAGANKKAPNFAETLKARSEEAARKATAATVSQEDAREHLKKERQENLKYKRDKENHRLAHEAATKNLEAAQKMVEGRKGEIDSLKKALDDAHNHHAATELEVKNRKVEIDNDGSKTDTEKRAAFRAEDDKIQRAKRTVEAIEGNLHAINDPVTKAQKELETVQDGIKRYDATVENEITEGAKRISGKSVEVAQNVAEDIARRRPGTLWGLTSTGDDVFARKARGTAKKKAGVKKLKARAQAERELLSDAGEASSEGGSS